MLILNLAEQRIPTRPAAAVFPWWRSNRAKVRQEVAVGFNRCAGQVHPDPTLAVGGLRQNHHDPAAGGRPGPAQSTLYRSAGDVVCLGLEPPGY